MGSTRIGDRSTWPPHLRPGALRWARASGRYEETVAFYRDLVGLPVLDEFRASFGADGTIFGLPDTTVQLEIIRADGDGAAGSFDQLVLYLDDVPALTAAVAPLRDAGLRPSPTPHPFWAANGAVTYRDPDGRDVVFAPWVFGVVPDPVDRPHDVNRSDDPSRPEPTLDIGWYQEDRTPLRGLFEEAEDSSSLLDTYIDQGRVLVARLADEVVGHLQLVDAVQDRTVELKNMAVAAEQRGLGIGRRLVDRALAVSRQDGYAHMIVATAAADIENLRFYQRRGFRLCRVERDAFDLESGYPSGLMIDGIPLRDRVWFTQTL